MNTLNETRTIGGQEIRNTIQSIKDEYAKAMLKIQILDDDFEKAFDKGKMNVKDPAEATATFNKIDKHFNYLRDFQTIINELEVPQKG